MTGLDDLLKRFESIKSGEAGKAVDQRLARAAEPQQAAATELEDMEQRLTSAYEQGRRDRGEEHGYLETIGKGLVRGAEGIASGVGSIGHWAGEAAGIDPLARGGKWMRDYFDKAAKEGWAAPDPVVFKGSFMDRPSLKRAAGIISEALPSLAAALTTGGVAAGGLRAAGVAAGAARKAGAAAGAFGLGALEGAPIYEEAREAGKSIAEASAYGGAATIGTGLLEFLPISQMMKPMAKGGLGKLAMKAVELGGEEAAQEGTQQIFQNAIAKYGYEATRDLTEGLVESIIGGFGSGAIAGTTSARINRWIEDRRKQGVPDDEIANDIDQLGNAVSDSMERKADEVSQAPVTEEITTNADAILKQAEMPQVEPEDILMGRQVPVEDIPPALRTFTPGAAIPPATTGPITPQSALDDMLDRFTAIQRGEKPTAPAGIEPTETGPAQPIQIPETGPEPQAPASTQVETPAEAVAKGPVTRPASLDVLQEKHIRSKIEQLGSLEAVSKLYSGDTTVEKYARALAEEKYGTAPSAPEAPQAPIKIEEPAEIKLGEDGKPVGGPRSTPEKPEKFTGKPGMAWVNDQQRPIVGAREITRGRKKGQFIVTLPNGKLKTVSADSIIQMPEEAAGQTVSGEGQMVSGEGQMVSETPAAAAKEPWQMTLADFKKANPDFSRPQEYHHDQVRFAQQRNLEVPPEVLAEYPDLKPAAPEAPGAINIEEVQPHDGWRDNLIKARTYAKGLGVDLEGVDWTNTESIVARIDEHLKKATAAEAPQTEITEEFAKSVRESKRFIENLIELRSIFKNLAKSPASMTREDFQLMMALTSFEGDSEKLLKIKERGATDKELKEFLGQHLGQGGGSSFGGYGYKGGANPAVAFDAYMVVKGQGRQLSGSKLIKAVRDLIGIGQPKAAADQINEMSMDEIDKVLDEEEKAAAPAEPEEETAPAAEKEAQPEEAKAPAPAPAWTNEAEFIDHKLKTADLSTVEVDIKAVDERGKAYTIKETASKAIEENESQIGWARRILECLDT